MGLRLDWIPYVDMHRKLKDIEENVENLIDIYDKMPVVWIIMYESKAIIIWWYADRTSFWIKPFFNKSIWYRKEYWVRIHNGSVTNYKLSLESMKYFLWWQYLYDKFGIKDWSVDEITKTLKALVDEMQDILIDEVLSDESKYKEITSLITKDYHFDSFSLDSYTSSMVKKRLEEKKEEIKYRSISEKMFEEHNNTWQLLWSIAYNQCTRQRNLLLGTIKDNKFRYKYRFDSSWAIQMKSDLCAIDWRSIRWSRSTWGPSDCLAYWLCTYNTYGKSIDEYESTASMFALRLSNSTDKYNNLEKWILEECSIDPKRAKQETSEEVAEPKANIPVKQESFINKSSTTMSTLNTLVRESFMEKSKKTVAKIASKTNNTIILLKKDRELINGLINDFSGFYNRLEDAVEHNDIAATLDIIDEIKEYSSKLEEIELDYQREKIYSAMSFINEIIPEIEKYIEKEGESDKTTKTKENKKETKKSKKGMK